MKFRLTLAFFSCMLVFRTLAQDKPNVKFGKISPADFAPAFYPIDSSADAIVIADIGSTELVDNGKGGFALEFKWYRRARIMNKNGYDLGNVSIPLYTNGQAEEELA